MRAAVVDRYGGPETVRIVELPRPRLRAGQVLVRVEATAVNASDSRIRGARFPAGFGVPARLALGLRGPRRQVLGGVFSGVVEESGSGELALGDEVCGMTGATMGAHAELVAVNAGNVVHKPPDVSHQEAAGVLFGGTAALHFLRDRAKVAPGSSVLVNGASGAIGTSAVQLARHLGARVTGVTSTPNLDLVAGLGAERVIDYTKTDPLALGERFDVVLDAVGNVSIEAGRRLLAPGGSLVLAAASLGETLRARGDVIAGVAPERAEDFAYLLELMVEGRLRVVTDSVFELSDIVEAHRRVDTGRKVGNVMVRIAVESDSPDTAE